MNQTTQNVSADVLASKGIRFANFIIDYIVIMIMAALIGVLIALFSELTGSYGLYELLVLDENPIVDYIFSLFIWLIYYTPFEGLTKGRSLGKYITKTKVVKHDGSEITITDALVRTLCRFIPFEQFSFLGTDGKGWHDSISKTYVVDVAKFEAKKETIEGLEEIGKIQA